MTDNCIEIEDATSMEITFDPIYHAVGMGIMIGEDHEILPDGEWILWCKRVSGIDDLFLYHHKMAGTFVLAKWIYSPQKDGIGIAMELEVMSDHPDKYPHDLPTAQHIRNRLKPQCGIAEQMKKGIRDRSKAKQQLKVEKALERHQVADWMERKGEEGAASLLRQRTGWTPDDTPEYESFKQDLKNSSKGRIVTGGK